MHRDTHTHTLTHLTTLQLCSWQLLVLMLFFEMKMKWKQPRGRADTYHFNDRASARVCVLLLRASYVAVHTLVDDPQQLLCVIKEGSCDWLSASPPANEAHMRLFCIFTLGRYGRGSWTIFVKFMCFITKSQLITLSTINVVFPIYTGTPWQQPSEKTINSSEHLIHVWGCSRNRGDLCRVHVSHWVTNTTPV